MQSTETISLPAAHGLQDLPSCRGMGQSPFCSSLKRDPRTADPSTWILQGPVPVKGWRCIYPSLGWQQSTAALGLAAGILAALLHTDAWSAWRQVNSPHSVASGPMTQFPLVCQVCLILQIIGLEASEEKSPACTFGRSWAWDITQLKGTPASGGNVGEGGQREGSSRETLSWAELSMNYHGAVVMSSNQGSGPLDLGGSRVARSVSGKRLLCH